MTNRIFGPDRACDQLRSQLERLRAQHDAVWRELSPTAQKGPDGRMLWRDSDLAAWMNCDADTVRSWVVQHLVDFAVDDECRTALLWGPQLVALTLDADVMLKAPRIRELDFVMAQLSLISRRLQELGGGAKENHED